MRERHLRADGLAAVRVRLEEDVGLGRSAEVARKLNWGVHDGCDDDCDEGEGGSYRVWCCAKGEMNAFADAAR